MEQKICIKFCFVSTLRRRLLSLMKCLKGLFVITPWAKHKPWGGIPTANMAKLQLRILNIRIIKLNWRNVEKVQQVIYEDRWHKINHVYKIIGLWYGTWWCLLTWGRLLQNLCPVCWMVTRNQTTFPCTRTCKIRPTSQKLPCWGHKRK